jgi:hypothetical protein
VRVAAALLAGSLALSAAAAADAPVLTVADVIARHEALNSQIVRVRGWLLYPCQPTGCGIRASKKKKSAGVSIGGSAEFDRAVAAEKALGREIVVEGRIKRDCFDHSKDQPRDPSRDVICLDRASQLAEPRLIEVLSTRKS